jgi:hypothetical protein
MSLRDIQNLSTITRNSETYNFRYNGLILDDGIQLTENNDDEVALTQYNILGGVVVFTSATVAADPTVGWPAVTVNSVRIGDVVTVTVKGISLTATANGATYITNLGSVLIPSWHRPSHNITGGCQCQLAGVNNSGTIMVLTTGEIRFYIAGVDFNVVATDTFGVPEGATISYTVLG